MNSASLAREAEQRIQRRSMDARVIPEVVQTAPSPEVRVVDPTTGGAKGQKLARFDLIPPRPLKALAEHYGKGAAKYEDRNWERGYKWSLSYAALHRHLNAWWSGEDNDPELGSSHLDAVLFHAMALREFTDTHPELDDRPGTAPALRSDWQ